ncbi:hypothetical protein CR513_39649, partial [Mucuna pruriens]
MDAYCGYNQIWMHPMDEAKTSFIIDGGSFCYKRLMDQIFKDRIGLDLEHKLKLNLEKCSFDIQAGKFLGFMLTRRCIEANLDKCEAVINMRSPRSVKEVQQLVGRITTLACFLSRSTKRALPIFQCLKKSKRFQWTKVCESTFQELKTMLVSPPVLSKPREGSMKGPTPNLLHQQSSPRHRNSTPKDRKGHFNSCHHGPKIETILLKQPDSHPDQSPHQASFKEARPGMTNGRMDGRIVKGSGADVVVEGPDGVLIEQFLQLKFKANNNQAEYVALLVGMRLTKEIKTQMLGPYEAKYAMKELHEWVCETHIGSRALASKSLTNLPNRWEQSRSRRFCLKESTDSTRAGSYAALGSRAL